MQDALVDLFMAMFLAKRADGHPFRALKEMLREMVRVILFPILNGEVDKAVKFQSITLAKAFIGQKYFSAFLVEIGWLVQEDPARTDKFRLTVTMRPLMDGLVLGDNVTVELCRMGAVIATGQLDDQNQIVFGDVPKGMYTLRFSLLPRPE